MKTKLTLTGAALWCVVLALNEFDSRWVYDLSKWAICAAASYLAYSDPRKWAKAVMVVIAVLFNPIARIRFEEDEWRVVDWLAAGGFVATAQGLRKVAVKSWDWAQCHSSAILITGLLLFMGFAALMVQRDIAKKEAERPAREAAEKEKKRAEMDRLIKIIDPKGEERRREIESRRAAEYFSRLQSRLEATPPSFYEPPPQ